MYRSSASGSSAARHLVGEAQAFGGTGAAVRGPACAGRQQLLKQMEKPEESFYHGGQDWTLLMPGALSVAVERIPLPEIAGTVKPEDHPSPQERSVFLDLSKLQLPAEEWPVPLRSPAT